MDPATITAAAYLISTIVGVGQAISSSVTNAMYKERYKKLMDQIAPIAEQMAKDTQLMEALSEAYARKDAKLMNNIMMSSPFGTRLQNLKAAYNKNQLDIDKLNKAKVSAMEEQARVNSEINKAQAKIATSGSIISDLINGGGSLSSIPTLPTYKSSGYTQNDLKGVTNGQKV
jgi:chromosome segregation ATPase